MIGNLLQGIFGKSPKGDTSNTSQNDPQNIPFGFLGHRAAKRALDYIANGQRADIISDIETWRSSQGNPSIRLSETNWLAGKFGGEPSQLVRYVELRKALNLGVPATIRGNQKYKETVALEVRVLLDLFTNSYSSGSGGVVKKGDYTDFQDVRKAVDILGGSDADILLYLLPHAGYAPSFYVPEINAWKDFSTSSVLDALGRIDNKTLALAIPFLKKNGKLTDPAAMPFLFEQLSSGSAKVRDGAQEALLTSSDRDRLEQMAIEALPGGSAGKRAAVVNVLGLLDTPTARAALEAHKSNEKTQSVLTSIELFLGSSNTVENIEGGYIDYKGDTVETPVHPLPTDDGSAPLDDSFLKKLHDLEAKVEQDDLAQYERSHQYWVERGRTGHAPKKRETRPFAQTCFEVLNNPVTAKTEHIRYFGYRFQNEGNALVGSVLDSLPARRVVDLACIENRGSISSILSYSSPFSTAVRRMLSEGKLHLSQLVQIAHAFKSNPDTADAGRQYLEQLFAPNRHYGATGITKGIWHLAAENMPLLTEALPPYSNDLKSNLRALRVLEDFPSLPQALVQPVLFAAIDPREKLHVKAQALLREVPGIDDHLINLLDDKRQAVRANTARFLADRETKDALPALAKRLKKEKSELAKADMISAVARLGGDTTPYLGKAALLKEAEIHVAKLPNAKIDFLDMATAPTLYWADGKPAEPVIMDAWLRLALKLKSPLGSPLFDLYLEQMSPDSAQAFCDWVLNSWIAHDTYRPAGDAAYANAAAQAKRILGNQHHWMSYTKMSEEDIIRHLLANMSATYQNSGADSKGILALTHRATPSTAAPMIATYLKQHGKRVSQAKAMVETLFGMGTGDAVQVLVATATRFKQRTVRERAAELVTELAAARGWTEDELADRSVATGGFDETGIIPLPIGEDEKAYMAQLGDDLTVQVFNPSGKAVKSLPAGKDANTKDSKALLSAAKKTIKTVTQQQTSRLYEAMLTPRVWRREDWLEDLSTHPIMKRLIERLVWRGLDDDGEYIGSFRMTAEGEFLNADGDDVDVTGFAKIDLAHTANLPEAEQTPWLEHLKDFEVKPLFPQMSRPLRKLDPDKKETTRIDDREGWMTTSFKLRSAAGKMGYDRGPVIDSGGFETYRKVFMGAGLAADLKFTGSYAGGEEDIPVAIEYMHFYQLPAPAYTGAGIPLHRVPPLLLSEVWNDLHEIAKTAAYDEDWQKKRYY